MSPWLVRQAQDEPLPPTEDRLLQNPIFFIFSATALAGTLSMATTWVLELYSSTPDDEAITFGLLGFLFVLFIDLCFILSFVMPEFQQGRRPAAVKRVLELATLGLLFASFVGVLPWFLRWVVSYIPWISLSGPWVTLLAIVANAFMVWVLLRKRRSAE